MLEGKCPKCGACYYGWALTMPRHQMCDKCGVGLEITQDGRKVATGYSPFTAKEYIIKPQGVPDKEEQKKDAGQKSGTSS